MVEFADNGSWWTICDDCFPVQVRMGDGVGGDWEPSSPRRP